MKRKYPVTKLYVENKLKEIQFSTAPLPISIEKIKEEIKTTPIFLNLYQTIKIAEQTDMIDDILETIIFKVLSDIRVADKDISHIFAITMCENLINDFWRKTKIIMTIENEPICF